MKKSWISRLKEDFNLNSVTEVYFRKSEWEKFDPHDENASVSLYYFAYRFFYMVWFVGCYVETFACNSEKDYNFYLLYLTNQTFTLHVVYSVLYFLYISWALLISRKQAKLHFSSENIKSEKTGNLESEPISFHHENYRLPFLCKVLWILINVLNVVPYVVTVIYWLVLYESHEGMRTCEILANVFVHGLNSPLALLDAFIIAVPIRRTHAIFPAIFAVFYTVFSALYEVFNGRYNAEDDKEYIYPILNWKNQPGFAVITSVASYLATFIIHPVMCWGVYRARLYFKSKCSKFSTEDL